MNKRIQGNAPSFWMIVATVLLVASSQLAIAADGVVAYPGERGITFEAQSPHQSVTVRVVGEDQVVQVKFAEGDRMFFSPREFNLPDGKYTYEAVLNPPANALLREPNSQGLPGRAARAVKVVGHFVISDGAVVAETEDARESGRDLTRQVDGSGLVAAFEDLNEINENLKVAGDACIGPGCLAADLDGSATMKLKDANPNVRFEDTSSSPVPTTDWEIAVNDPSAGGADQFVIRDLDSGTSPFVIEGNSPTGSVHIANGRIGMGTSTPVTNLQIATGDTPTLRLEQNGSAGFGPQTWDIGGNETSFFVGDATNASQRPFQIFRDAGEDLLVLRDGRVGVGTSSPQAAVHVQQAVGAYAVGLQLANNSGTGVRLENTGYDSVDLSVADNGRFRINFNDGDNYELELEPGGALTLHGGIALGVAPQSTTALRTMVDITNNGGSQIRFLDTSNGGSTWRAGKRSGTDDFQITKDGSGLVEFLVEAGGDVSVGGSLGIGTASPEDDLHIVDAGPARLRLENQTIQSSSTLDPVWTINSNGDLRFTAGVDSPEMRLDAAGDLSITGQLTTAGSTCGSGCDRVFSSDYDLPSIAQHAEEMWESSHLPNVGPTVEGEALNLTDLTLRMLNELEKAHIYIEQLHERLAQLEKVRDE